MAIEKTGGEVVDFASRRTLDEHEVEEATEKYGFADARPGVRSGFAETLDSMVPAVTTLAGTHRGALAGLSEDERDKAIDEYLAGSLSDAPEDEGGGVFEGFDVAAILREQCEDGPVRTKLSQLLMAAPLDWLQEASADFGMGDFSSTSKKKVASRLATAMGQDLAMLERGLGGLSRQEFEGIRRVVDAGGTLVVAEDEVNLGNLKDLPIPTPPLLFAFHHDAFGDDPATFAFVVADELVALAQRVDWDAALQPILKRDRLCAYVEAAVGMRGIVEQEDLIACYGQDVADGFADDELVVELPYALRGAESSPWALLTADEVYLISDSLASLYLDDHPECEPQEDSPLIEGELDQGLLDLLDRQAEFEPAPIGPEVLEAPNFLEWLSAFPSATALRDFIDEHMLDTEDDYCFADSFVEAVQTMGHIGFTPDEYRVYIERAYPVDDPDLLVRAYELAMAAAEDVPRWDLNGWSIVQARDLVEVEE